MPSVTANFYPLQPSSISLSPFRIRMDASLLPPPLRRPILTGPRPVDQIPLAPLVYLSGAERYRYRHRENHVVSGSFWRNVRFLVENRRSVLYIKGKFCERKKKERKRRMDGNLNGRCAVRERSKELKHREEIDGTRFSKEGETATLGSGSYLASQSWLGEKCL